MYYSWTVDNTDIVTGADYTLGGTNSNILTIKDLQRGDRNNQYVCKAKEGDQSQQSQEGVSSAVTIDVMCK